MLHVLLTIGKVLLIILAVVLALLILILCAPFCYRAQVRKDAESFAAGGLVSWLWIVLRVKFGLKEKQTSFEVWFLGIPVMRLLRFIKKKKGGAADGTDEEGRKKPSGKKLFGRGPKKRPPEAETAATQEAAEAETAATQEAAEDAGPQNLLSEEDRNDQLTDEELQKLSSDGQTVQDKTSTGQVQVRPDEALTENSGQSLKQRAARQKKALEKRRAARSRERERRQEARQEARARRKEAQEQKAAARRARAKERRGGGGFGAKLRRAKEKLSSLFEKLRWGWELIHSDMFKGALAVVRKQGIGMLRHIMPRRISGFVRFGFDDPSRTGQVTGIIAMVYPKLPKKLKVQPVFDEKCLDADLTIRGHICLICLLFRGIMILLNKNVRSLIKTIKSAKRT